MNELPPSPLVIKTERPSESYPPGLFIAIGKRVFPKATDRNLLRRRIKGALRELGHYQISKRLRIRIMIFPSAKTATYQEIKTALDQEFRSRARSRGAIKDQQPTTR